MATELAASIQDLAILLTFAFIISILFSRLNQPVIVGYIVAGSIIGPHALKFISNVETVNLFAELSIVFLIFSIGLEFNLKRLRKVGGVAIFTGVMEILLIIGIGNASGRLLGLSYVDSIFLGGILAISSTTVIAKLLTDRKQLNREFAQIILGILIIEDIAAIILLTVFGGVAAISLNTLLLDILIKVIEIILFFIVSLVIGLKVVPFIINTIGKQYSHEILLITALGMCFSLSAYSRNLGFSEALGAFLMGAIISETNFSREIERSMVPIRVLFTTIFFVSVGMLVDFSIIKDILPIIFIISVLAVFLKLSISSIATYLSGYGALTSLYVGAGLIPRGEFSLIIAKLGTDTGILSPVLYQTTVAVALITTLLTSDILNSVPSIYNFFEGHTPRSIKEVLNYLVVWIDSLKKQFHGEIAHKLKGKLIDISINVIIILLVILSLAGVNKYLLKDSPLWLIIWSYIAAGVFMLPSIFIIHRRTNEVIDLFIEILEGNYGIFSRFLIKKVVRNMIYIVIVFILAVDFFPLIIAELPVYGYIPTAMLFVVIVLCGYFFWKTVSYFNSRLDLIIRETILSEHVSEDREHITGDVIESIKRRKMVWEVRIPLNSPFSEKSVAESNIRGITGATILYIVRNGNLIENVLPETRLEGGDLLVILGSEEVKEKTLEYLREGTVK